MCRSQRPQPMDRNMHDAQDFHRKGASLLQRLAALLLVCPLAAALLGCGGGGSSKSSGTNGTPSISVAVSPATSTVQEGKTQAFTATLTNDSGAKGVNWTVTCSVSSCGTLSGATTTSVTYTAPGPVASNLTVTVTATSVADATKTATATISVPAIAVVVAPSTATVNSGTSTQSFTATVTNDPGNTGATWALSGAGCAGVTCGTLSATSSASGTPVAYTAPAAVPTPATVTLTATSVTDTTKTATATITVTLASACGTGGSESLLNGQYAFLLKGFDNGTGAGETSPQPVLVGGVISADGAGHITAGAMDMNLNSGVQTNLSVTSGSYGVTSDQRGCMVISTSAGTQNYRFSLGNISSGVASTGHMINFDTTGPFTAGIMRKQTTSAFSTSQVTGNYAFGVSSPQNNVQCNHSGVCGGKFGAVGVLNFAAGSVTGGEVDLNFKGELDANPTNTNWPASPIPFSSGGSYSISALTGRGTLVFTLAVTGASPINTIIYVVSQTEILVMSSDSQTKPSGNNIFAGEALQQPGAPFSANPLSGTYIGYDSGLGSSGSGRTDIFLAGPLTLGNNSLNLTQQRDDSGTFTSTLFSGSYSVSNSGRMIFTPTTGHAPVLYLVSSSQAFFLIGNGSVDSGFLQAQSGSPFSNSSASGTYAFGTINPEVAAAADTSGVATLAPAATTVNTTQDHNSSGSQTLGGMQTQSYSVDATGLVYIPAGCTLSATSTTCQVLGYIVSPTRVVIMNTSNPTPNTQVLDQ